MMEEERATTPLAAALEAISQPNSASTAASAAIAQLPALITMAGSATSSPQLKTATPPEHASTTPPPPTELTPVQEPQVQELELQLPPTTTATTPIPALAPVSPPTQFTTYTQAAIAEATTTPSQGQGQSQSQSQGQSQGQGQDPAPAPIQTPMPAPPMQMPIVTPIPVTMNNHIASSPAAHAPTPSGNLVCVKNWQFIRLPLCYLPVRITIPYLNPAPIIAKLLNSMLSCGLIPNLCNRMELGKRLPDKST
ncbi:hypothetical protein GGS24DRAFT_241420 [Hypoxylon argillaceum]|nr:hypothetical protein GGS24DRAFT_241420 [Hypoxylon argillaceum]